MDGGSCFFRARVNGRSVALPLEGQSWMIHTAAFPFRAALPTPLPLPPGNVIRVK